MAEGKGPREAREQWKNDTAREIVRWEEESRKLPDGINQEKWTGWLHQHLEGAGDGNAPTAYRHLLQLHCAGRVWTSHTLTPLLQDSPHRLITAYTLDLEEDIIEEMIQPSSLTFSRSPISEEKPNRYNDSTTPQDWLEWSRKLDEFLQDRAEICDEARMMATQDAEIPDYTGYQVVQNMYDLTVSLCVTAQQWGELLARTSGASLED